MALALGAGIFSPAKNDLSDTFWTERTTAIQSDASGNYLLGTINGIFKTPGKHAPVKKWITGTSADQARITEIKIDHKNRIWIDPLI